MAVESPKPTWVPELTFGQRLLVLRVHLQLTQSEIAAQCGVHPATWNTWEHGTSPRNMAGVAEKISDATGVDRGWLLWGTPIILGQTPTQLVLPFTNSRHTYEEDSHLEAAGF